METHKLSVKALAITSAILWGGGLLLVGVMNLYRPGYGNAFLQVMSSVYPGYDGMASWKSIGILTACGVFDGVMCGIAAALIYNLCLGRCTGPSKQAHTST